MVAKLLTKSLFKLAVECPRKLYYADHSDAYENKKSDNDFLQSLAVNGHQVGELAKLMYPGGEEVDSKSHEVQIVKTAELLERNEVAIYEGAIRYGDLFARVDVLNKVGSTVELIEVKAKSFRSSATNPFCNVSGEIDSKMLPHLRDVAFQRYIFSKAYPHLKVHAFLMLADKDKTCSVSGLNQIFKVVYKDGKPEIVVDKKASLQTIGEPILSKVNVDALVDRLLQ